MPIRFGPFEIDTSAKTLTKDGVPIQIKPRPLELLCCLAASPGKVFSKDEVIAEVWRGRVVSDTALSSAIRDIRRVLENAGYAEEVVKTHYGYGFGFTAKISDDASPPIATAAKRSYPRALAVMPLVLMCDDVSLKNHADGLVDDVIFRLTKFRSLRVLARKSTFVHQAKDQTIAEIAQNLAADYVLEGSLRELGPTIRINVNLIAVSDESQLWAESIDFERSAFVLGDSRAADAVVSVVPKIINDHELHVARALRLEQLDPWQCYLRGSERLETFLPEHQTEAIALFERAIELDPTFADPHASLAYALCVMNQNLEDDPTANRQTPLRLRSLEEAKKATVLDANMDFAWVALARVHYALGHLEDAISAAERAIEINPNLGLAYNWLGLSHLLVNDPQRAIEAFDQALTVAPKATYRWLSEAGRSLAALLLGQYQDAIKWSRRAQRQPKATYVAYLGEICAQSHLGQGDATEAAIKRVRQINRDFCLRLVRHDFPLTNAAFEGCLISGLERAGIT